jgi:hypothetical protein
MTPGRRFLLLALVLLLASACTSDEPSGPTGPVTLSMGSAPAAARAAVTIAPGIVVRVQPNGFSGNVTAAIDSGTGVLQGTTTVRASGGAATFSDLRISGVGPFTLRFTIGEAAVTHAIIVSPDSGSRLVLRTAPSVTVLSGTVFATQPIVELRTPNALPIAYPVLVQATLVRGNGILTGTTTTTSASGSATFSGLGAEGFSGATMRFSAFGFQSVDANTTIQIFGLYVRPRLTNDRDTLTVARDTPVNVSIRFVTGPNDIVGSARFDIVWDPRLLTLMQDQGVGNTNVLVNRLQAADGVMQVTLTASDGLTGTPDVMNLTFRTAGTSGEGPVSTRILEVRAPDGRDIFRSNVSSTVRVLIP